MDVALLYRGKNLKGQTTEREPSTRLQQIILVRENGAKPLKITIDRAVHLPKKLSRGRRRLETIVKAIPNMLHLAILTVGAAQLGYETTLITDQAMSQTQRRLDVTMTLVQGHKIAAARRLELANLLENKRYSKCARPVV